MNNSVKSDQSGGYDLHLASYIATQFYLAFPSGHTLKGDLTGGHICGKL